MENSASPTSKLSEAEFLRLQAALAKAQAKQSLDLAAAALARSADPRQITRKHPLIAVASVAAAAFVAAVVAIPSKQESELRHLERIRRAMNPQPTPPPTQGSNGHDGKAAEKSSWVGLVLKELLQIIRPLLMTAITANIKAAANPPAPQAQPVDGQNPSASF